MIEFEPEVFERVAADGSLRVDKTQIMVGLAMVGMLPVFEIDDPGKPVTGASQEQVSKSVDLCKSNAHPVLDAADINESRRR